MQTVTVYRVGPAITSNRTYDRYMRVSIELSTEQSGWGPTRQVIARLSRDGYHVEQHAAAGAGYLSLWGARPTSEQALACQPPARSAKRP